MKTDIGYRNARYFFKKLNQEDRSFVETRALIKKEVLKNKKILNKLLPVIPTYDDELRAIGIKHQYYGNPDNKIKVAVL